MIAADILIVIGMLGFIVFLVALVVAAIQKKPKKPYLIGLPICFALLIVGAVISPDTKNSTSNTSNTSSIIPSSHISSEAINESSNPQDNIIKMNYKTLYKEYSDNPIKADSKYKDKEIQLTGKIADIDRDIGKNPYITFNVDEYGAQNIKMSFDDDKPVANLKKGQKVTVVGTCSGTLVSTIVVLNDCSIVK